jgi:hypothetical protein
MKSSCLPEIPNEPLIQVKRWQYKFCNGNATAAALLSYFAYWHDIKLESREQAKQKNKVAEQHGDEPTQDTSLWQFQTEKQLEEGIMISKREAIRKAIIFLQKRGVLEVATNPNPRFKFDRTKYFLFKPEKLERWLKAYINRKAENRQSKAENRPRSAENSGRSAENLGTIPEITSEITFESGEESASGNAQTEAPATIAPAPQFQNQKPQGTGDAPYPLPNGPGNVFGGGRRPITSLATDEVLSAAEKSLIPVQVQTEPESEALKVYREFYPTLSLSPDQETDITRTAKDIAFWRRTCQLWKRNNSKGSNIGNLLDRYENDLKKSKQQKQAETGIFNHPVNPDRPKFLH